MLAMCAAPQERIALRATPVIEGTPPEGSAWSVGEEMGYRAGCFSKRAMLAVAENGTTAFFYINVNAGFCFVTPNYLPGRVSAFIAGPFEAEHGMMGSVWEIKAYPFGTKFYMILGENPRKPKQMNYKEA